MTPGEMTPDEILQAISDAEARGYSRGYHAGYQAGHDVGVADAEKAEQVRHGW